MTSARILIVDDDWLNIEVMQAYLSGEDYVIETAYSGEAALEQIHATPPDVILMDVRMSGIDGYETTKRLKASDTTRHIPVLLVTALSDRQDIQKAVDAGVDEILFKPISSPIMLLRVRVLVRLKQLYDQVYG